MELSRRLTALIEMAQSGDTVADVGCDHGFVSIELVRQKKFRRAIAMDIRPDPLARAREHVREAGMEQQIDLRLSDGLEAVLPGEADTILIAGMGGPLMIQILERGREAALRTEKLILSPHSEWGLFRRYLLSHGYRISSEEMLQEDGKYYIILCCRPAEPEEPAADWQPEEQEYGRWLLERRDPILKQYLEGRLQLLSDLEARLREADTGKSRQRLPEICREKELAERAIRRWQDGV